MEPQNLDLSEYPKIVPPSNMEDKTELEKRSKAITNIRAIMENLIKALTAYVDDLITWDEKVKLLNERERTVKLSELDQDRKMQEFQIQKDELDKEKEANAVYSASLKKREEKLDENKRVLEKIETATRDYEEAKAQAVREQGKLAEAKKDADKLVQKEKELDDREALVIKSEEVDTIRKNGLDLRESRIHAQEVRLGLEQKE